MSFKWSDSLRWSAHIPWNWTAPSGMLGSPINMSMTNSFRFRTHQNSSTSALTGLDSLELISMTFSKKAGIMVSEAGERSVIVTSGQNSQGVTFG